MREVLEKICRRRDTGYAGADVQEQTWQRRETGYARGQMQEVPEIRFRRSDIGDARG